MARPKISAAIITLDEERNIARCLDSIAGVVDEVVVLDSNSTDGTQDICHQRGVRFIQHPWEGYAPAKNRAIRLAQHPYVLSLDADEALSKELRQSILREKDNGLSGAYCFNRLTNYCGRWIRHSGWYPDRKLRLFPKTQTQWVGEYVHEEARVSPGVGIRWLPGDLLHYSYTSFDEHRTRADHYSQLTARKLFEQGKAASTMKPPLSLVGRFFSMYVLKLGFLDGYYGLKIAQISAMSNHLKYQELNRLHRRGSGS